ncbi:MAG: hypothetical protein CL946_07345 [Ectothiorhodospiraceae bacterium]|nr:hypothetical protein [Ectothiorhodospiraceae bacterium]
MDDTNATTHRGKQASSGSGAVLFPIIFSIVPIGAAFALYYLDMLPWLEAPIAVTALVVIYLVVSASSAKSALSDAAGTTKEVEKDASLREELLATLFDHSYELIIHCKRDGTILRISDNAATLLGSSADFLKERNIRDLVDEKNHSELADLMGGVSASNISVSTSIYLRPNNKKPIPAEVTCSHVSNGIATGPTTLLLTFNDISQQRKYHKQAESYKQAADALFENEVFGCFVLTPDGDFVRINKTFLHQFKYVEGELDRRSFLAVVKDEDKESIKAALEDLNNGSMKTVRNTLGLMTKEREEQWIELGLFQTNNAVFGVTVEMNQVRDLEKELELLASQLEGALFQTNKLSGMADSANKAKNSFIAVMSHEIRTPLNAIMGMTNLLMDTKLNEVQEDYLDTIRVSGEDLLSVINDILDFTMLEAGKIEMHESEFTLRECVEESFSTVKTKAAAKDLQLSYIMDEDVPEQLSSDRSRVQQILTHLLANAVKFTPVGEIVLEVHKTDNERSSAVLEFAVRDTGIGISKEDLSSLFQSFNPLDTSHTRGQRGIGLGLAICKHLVELMGGKIWVDSTENVGSTFYFTLPVGIPEQQPQSYLQPHPLLDGKDVILIEGNTSNMVALTMYTKSFGMQPSVTATYEEAIELVQSGKPVDVIIVDIYDRSFNGIHPVEAIRMYDSSRVIPFIIVGHQRFADDHRDISLSSFIPKPISPSQLRKALMEVFGHQSEFRQLSVQEALAGTDNDHEVRILLAEDNHFNRKVALLLLDKMGLEVDIAVNGLEVLEQMKHHTYDIILMDIEMPEMDGIEASKRIRSDYREDIQPKIVAMTAHAFSVVKDELREAGIDDFISKPVKPKALTEAIHRNLNIPLTSVNVEEDENASLLREAYSQDEVLPSVEPEESGDEEASQLPTEAVPPADEAESHRSSEQTMPESVNDSPISDAADEQSDPDEDVPQETDAAATVEEKAPEPEEEDEATLPSDPDFLNQLYDLFLEETPALMNELSYAVQVSDLEKVRFNAHTLKSNAATLGANRLRELCASMEGCGKTNDLDCAMSHLKDTILEYKKVYARIKSEKSALLERAS